MTRFEMTYPKPLLDAWRVSDSHSGRYDTNYVRVDFPSEVVESTNGRIIVRHRFSKDSDDSDAMGVVYFRRDELKRAARLLAKDWLFPGVFLAKDGDSWFAKSSKLTVSLVALDKVCWPRIEKVCECSDSANSPSVEFCFRHDVLRSLCAIASRSDEGSLKFSIPLNSVPFAVVDIGEGEASAWLSFAASDSGKSVQITEPQKKGISQVDE